ncbi:hypothetical protein Nepgr_027688 [Nepenthes gracilis]|uniref:RIN4 pathogenic type III effector avirulence factor Avr cleavage site domain-containing protein n=1 Tax=Nepenthes gracilis TaxID=150966 RepID=A0AAD3Y372_NEPGR|nr:hypothetical protein Nepgr_027688 [Nepenthes gracilis]
MANSKVPKFGAWEEEENVAYTTYFENARKYKNPGQMAHPNDPQRNLDMFPHQNPPTGSPLHVLKAEPKELPTYEQRTARVGGNSRKAASTPPRQNNMSCSSTNEQVQQHPGGRASLAGDHRNPGGATRRRGSDILAGGTGVPKFGGWVDDPEQAEAYTSVFDGLRQQKRGQAIPSDGPSNATPSHQTDNAKKGCCFPWFKP